MISNFKNKILKLPYNKTEEELKSEHEWIRIAQKDPVKFNLLYDKYFDQIFNFIYRRTDDENLTADLTSQTFLKALQNLKKYKIMEVPFSAWLYKIASNEVNKHFRNKKTRRIYSLEETMVGKLFAETEEEPDERKLKLLIDFLKRLNSDEIEALELRFFENKEFKEIAFILEMSESAVKMKTYRALEKLREFFDVKKQRI